MAWLWTWEEGKGAEVWDKIVCFTILRTTPPLASVKFKSIDISSFDWPGLCDRSLANPTKTTTENFIIIAIFMSNFERFCSAVGQF